MGRINTNVPSLIARNNLDRVSGDLNTRLERIATGLRINRGRDDPAGLIISERIRSDLEGIDAGIRNAERASSVIATTESSLIEVNELLNTIRALTVESANTGANSSEERAANQLQIDSAIASITRIANTSTFGGLNLLNGDLDYTTSGINRSQLANVKVNGATFIDQASLQVNVELLASAQTGQIFLSGFGNNGGTAGSVTSSATLRIRGNLGVSTIELVSGTALSSLVATVNNLKSVTGISASLINSNANSGVVFSSTEYGDDAFASVERVGGPTDGTDSYDFFKFQESTDRPADSALWASAASLVSATRDEGDDAQALINGTLANGNGLEISINTPTLAVEVLLDTTYGTTVDGTVSNFDITGGGALFQLGPEVSALQQQSIGIQSSAAEVLGATLVNGSLQFLSSLSSGKANDIASSVASNDFTGASRILESAIDEITILRGRLGAFERNTLQTNVRSLQAQFENLSASASVIRDADFALETSRLTRAQTLQQASQSALALANQNASQVLQLLG